MVIGYPQNHQTSSRMNHPSTPMVAGPAGVQEFTVTRATNLKCPLMKWYYVDNKFVTYSPGYSTTYKVMKTEEARSSGEKQLLFYAIHGPSDFTPTSTGGKLGQYRTMYVGQVAWAKCTPGKLDKVEVNDKPRDARQCGIATVLTELCFLDPDIYQKRERNEAFNILEAHAVEANCKQAVSLAMTADPMIGAYAYFSAASRTGYNKLIVNWPFIDEDKISVYDTNDAKKSYDAKTGYIESQICCNNEKRCDSNKANWVFCKE